MQDLKRDYNILTSEKAYILGVLCGDGYLNNKRKRIALCNVKDEDFADIFKDQIIKQYGINICKYKTKKGYFSLLANSCLVYEDLLKYDI